MPNFHPFKLEAKKEVRHNLFKPSFPNNQQNTSSLRSLSKKLKHKALEYSRISRLIQSLYNGGYSLRERLNARINRITISEKPKKRKS